MSAVLTIVVEELLITLILEGISPVSFTDVYLRPRQVSPGEGGKVYR